MTSEVRARPQKFTGQLTGPSLRPGVTIRIMPGVHDASDMPPIPPCGCIVPIATDSGRINAEVIESREKGLVLKADGHLLGAIPARPFKA